jgi:prophage antirepressor-like protein
MRTVTIPWIRRGAVSELDTDEKDVVITDTLGGLQKTIIVSEPGLYNLSKRSNKPGPWWFQDRFWLSPCFIRPSVITTVTGALR